MKIQITPNTFYRSANCECNAVVFVEKSGIVRFIKGSTLVAHRPSWDKIPPMIDEYSSKLAVKADSLTEDMVIYNALDTPKPFEMRVIEDYKFASIEDATLAMVGRDDANPEDFWEPVFPT